ncbi:MAG TPA: HypC/HybG/HupF family hydrogenase formation chaperone [Candidatus Methylomirabilis sp.]|nr:HypC/HybG/HupF family hydrogenase formation chaperone [Candidatus Methylomirabilis sp.]
MCLGVPGKIVDIYEVAGLRMGRVDFGGVVKEACLEYVRDAEVGEYTVIHVGFAIGRLDEAEAQRSLEFLRAAGLLSAELGDGTAEGGP